MINAMSARGSGDARRYTVRETIHAAPRAQRCPGLKQSEASLCAPFMKRGRARSTTSTK